ncbi:MAG: hypothetical protein ACI4UE_03345 [Candidatus Scatovivens sp.]
MEEKKKIKISLKVAIIIGILMISTIIGLYFMINYFINRKYVNYDLIEAENGNAIEDKVISKLISIEEEEFKKFKDYFVGANVSIEEEKSNSHENGYFSGSAWDSVSSSQKIEFKNQAEYNFNLLKTYILYNDIEIVQKILENLENQKLYEYGNKLTVVDEGGSTEISQGLLNKFYAYVCSGLIKKHFNFDEFKINITKIEKNNSIDIYMTINNKYLAIFEYNKAECYLMLFNGTKYDIEKEEIIFDHIGGYNSIMSWHRIENTPSIDKPIIYVYPQKETQLSIKLGYPEKITCSYPKYTTSWDIIAKENGDLIDIHTNRSLYALYYESEPLYEAKVEEDGFIVSKENCIEFLEEKLEILGLNERETEEFIIYWLPKLEENKYNYIRFATMEEINKNMPLEFSIQPDNLIRILMTYKGLEKPIDINEQELKTPERSGFVVVEWGGTEIR